MLIIHGEDVVASRQYLNELIETAKQKGRQIVRLEAKRAELADLSQAIDSLGLFGGESLVVVFDIFGLKAGKRREAFIDWLKKNLAKKIIIYEDRQIHGGSLKALAKAQIKLFKPNPIIFKLVENLRPGNSRTLVLLYEQLLAKGEAAEFIFAMLVRQVRLLIVAKGDSAELKLASWQKTRLLNQAKSFEEKQLLGLHQRLYEIDKGIKTGRNPLGLEEKLLSWLLQL